MLTVDGYARLAEIVTEHVISSEAFVAMWFDSSMDIVYRQGIKPGIKTAGYNPVHMQEVAHVNKIDDEIIAAIKRAHFVVADFTHGQEGPRGGVYYEAGYAHALNKKVIFTCPQKNLKMSILIHANTITSSGKTTRTYKINLLH